VGRKSRAYPLSPRERDGVRVKAPKIPKNTIKKVSYSGSFCGFNAVFDSQKTCFKA
jgi:hypothetical protein